MRDKTVNTYCDLRFRFCNDIRLALNISVHTKMRGGICSDFGDLINKGIMVYDNNVDSPVNKSLIMTHFDNLVGQIRNAVARDGKASEPAFYNKGKKVEIENVKLRNQFWMDIRKVAKKGSEIGALINSCEDPEYDLDRLEIGVPSLFHETPIEKLIQLSFEEYHLELSYIDTFSQKEEDIVKEMHLRLAGIINSVDYLADLRYNPEYELHILFSEKIPFPDQKKLYEKLTEDAKRIHHKMHLMAKSELGLNVYDRLKGFENLVIPKHIIITGTTPKPESYLSLVEVLQKKSE